MAYRVYYKHAELDPSFPAPLPAKDIVVPAEKPKSGVKPYYVAMNSTDGDEEGGADEDQAVLAAIVGGTEDSMNDRRSVLKEVREVSGCSNYVNILHGSWHRN